jgi:hypothetical protein
MRIGLPEMFVGCFGLFVLGVIWHSNHPTQETRSLEPFVGGRRVVFTKPDGTKESLVLAKCEDGAPPLVRFIPDANGSYFEQYKIDCTPHRDRLHSYVVEPCPDGRPPDLRGHDQQKEYSAFTPSCRPDRTPTPLEAADAGKI